MLLSGESYEMAEQMKDVLEGYTQFHHFNRRELNLIEALRTLRMLAPCRMAGKTLAGPGLSHCFSVVRRAPLLGRPGAWPAGTTGPDAGRANTTTLLADCSPTVLSVGSQ